MTPSNAIDTLFMVRDRVTEIAESIAEECDRISQQWEGLGAVGGQRDDHAAALMSNLLPALRAMSDYTAACRCQLEAMKADPFGDDE